MGCSKTHFYRLVASGELPSVRFGTAKGTLVMQADCERYLHKWEERMDNVSADKSMLNTP
jgi:excisionase family DNA binding protein